MKVYKSKISTGLLIFLFLILGTSMSIMLYQKLLAGALILFLPIMLIIHLFRNTYYTIDGDQLHVKSGFIYNSKIDINHIKKIARTRSILSAPTLSFDRLEISYNKFDSVIISPENKEEFINDLKKINEGILVDLKG